MDAVLVSVIVPIYCVEKYLDKCVESIVNQTYKNLEIILVDDGSPDNCPIMCDVWAEKDSRIKVIHKENGGVSSARNAALAIASGEYIGFVDGDDYIEPNMFETLLREHIANCCQLTVCGIFFNGNSICFSDKEIINSATATERLFDYKKYQSFNGWSCNKLFNSEIIHHNTLTFDESIAYCEDVLFVYQYIKYIDKVLLLNVPLYYYVYREDACTVKKNYKNDTDVLELIDYFLGDTMNSKQVRLQIINWAVRSWITASRNYIIEKQEKEAYIQSRKRIQRHIFSIVSSDYHTIKTKTACIIIAFCPHVLRLLIELKEKI